MKVEDRSLRSGTGGAVNSVKIRLLINLELERKYPCSLNRSSHR